MKFKTAVVVFLNLVLNIIILKEHCFQKKTRTKPKFCSDYNREHELGSRDSLYASILT